jgi:hypothetical protein
MTSKSHIFFRTLLLALSATGFSSVACSGAAPTEAVEAAGESRQALTCPVVVTQEDKVDTGWWMTSRVDYNATSGVANVTTTVSDSRQFVGWTGGAIAAFVDQNGQLLYITDVHTRGVDGCWLFSSCPRTATVGWSETLPAGIRGLVAGVSILHKHTPKDQALFKVLKFLEDTKPACVLAPGPWEIACGAVAEAAAIADPLLADQNAQALQQVVTEMKANVASSVYMYPPCAPSQPYQPACTNGQTINCNRLDGTSSYKICSGGQWGSCL